MNQLIEKASEYKLPLCLAFVDYEKAFDSIEVPFAMKALESQGVNPSYINTYKSIYKKNIAYLRLHEDSESFNLERGTKQGDPSSDKLFNASLQQVYNKLDWEEKGIKIDGEYLNNLRFADDGILISGTSHQLQEMLTELDQTGKKAGLKMNVKKTKVMFNQYATEEEIYVGNNKLESVRTYVYLGQIVKCNPDKQEEVKRRIKLGWQAFGRMSSIFKSNLPLCLKRKVYDQCITPTITYGSETWNLNKAITLKIRSAQRAMERIMMGLTWEDRKTAKWIREQTQVRDIIEVIKKNKWTWAGHVMRRTDNRWTKRITEWIPREGTRNRGKQRTRWRDEIQEFAGPTWSTLTQDRVNWRTMGEAFVLQWTRIMHGC